MSSAPIRVLVVDDEASICHSLMAFFDDYDLEVDSAGSAEEALGQIASSTFNVAIVDLRLPGKSGETLIKLAHEISPTLRFMIHTGSTTYQLSEEMRSIGVRPEHVFIKPQVDLSVFLGAVKDLMRESDIARGKDDEG